VNSPAAAGGSVPSSETLPKVVQGAQFKADGNLGVAPLRQSGQHIRKVRIIERQPLHLDGHGGLIVTITFHHGLESIHFGACAGNQTEGAHRRRALERDQVGGGVQRVVQRSDSRRHHFDLVGLRIGRLQAARAKDANDQNGNSRDYGPHRN
jgi:hypothetical protein